jgi:tetratricopeptide (TPR) repeat protein
VRSCSHRALTGTDAPAIVQPEAAVRGARFSGLGVPVAPWLQPGATLAVLVSIVLLAVSSALWAASGPDRALVRARELEQAGEFRAAIRVLESAADAGAPDSGVMNQLALLYAKDGQFGKARSLFGQVLQGEPQDLFAQLWVGILDLSQENLPGAFSAFHRLAGIRPADDSERYFLANAYYFLGAIYSFRRDLDNALKALEAARQANPRDADTRYRLGSLYHDLGQLPMAETEYLEAVRLNERHVKALNALGWFYYNQKRPGNARERWQQTLRFSPKNNEARDSLAKLYNDTALSALKGGDRAEARRLWQKVFVYDPKNRAAKHYLSKYR